MSSELDQMQRMIEKILDQARDMGVVDVPRIDLYMDQVTTFTEEALRPYTRHPDQDKILTKTMINNYVKNKVLIPPVKKKYGSDHLLLLLMIFCMKSVLSIEDISKVIGPVSEKYTRPTTREAAEKREGELSLQDIYNELLGVESERLGDICADMEKLLDSARESFADAPEQEREELQLFLLESELSVDIYLRKLILEKIIDRREYERVRRQEREAQELRLERERRQAAQQTAREMVRRQKNRKGEKPEKSEKKAEPEGE